MQYVWAESYGASTSAMEEMPVLSDVCKSSMELYGAEIPLVPLSQRGK
jgi:hypothetical protein